MVAECIVDPDVFERFQAGDEGAIKSVYSRYSGAVYAVSLSILHDHGWAADATQQTFIKAWLSAASYDPGRAFAPWLYAIARRSAIDIYRRERRRTPTGTPEVVVEDLSFARVWESFEVRLAVDQLSDEEREVIRMSHFEELTHSEIAERLDVPVGTVKSRSHRAHKNLLKALDHLRESS